MFVWVEIPGMVLRGEVDGPCPPKKIDQFVVMFVSKPALEVGSGAGPKLVLEIWISFGGKQQGEVRVLFQSISENMGMFALLEHWGNVQGIFRELNMLDFRWL